MKAWRIEALGDPWTQLVVRDIPDLEPKPGMVRIRVVATDLNFADILQCQGRYQVRVDPPFTPGLNAAGIVDAVGAGTDIPIGAPVIAPTVSGFGGYAEQALAVGKQVTLLPDDVDLEAASAAHVTYGTAWFGLHHRGQLQKGETVLVLAAAGGVGSAAVELAREHGCWVAAAAGGPAKVAACEALAPDAVIDYDNEDLYARVMALTDGRGVDVVYDPVGGQYFDVAKRLVAFEGRLLLIGFASGEIPAPALNHALVKNYAIVGVHMGGYRGRDETPFKQCYAEIHRLLATQRIRPLIGGRLGFADLTRGLRDLAERRSTGRLMFLPDGG